MPENPEKSAKPSTVQSVQTSANVALKTPTLAYPRKWLICASWRAVEVASEVPRCMAELAARAHQGGHGSQRVTLRAIRALGAGSGTPGQRP